MLHATCYMLHATWLNIAHLGSRLFTLLVEIHSWEVPLALNALLHHFAVLCLLIIILIIVLIT